MFRWGGGAMVLKGGVGRSRRPGGGKEDLAREACMGVPLVLDKIIPLLRVLVQL